jgi:hypothetical protein
MEVERARSWWESAYHLRLVLGVMMVLVGVLWRIRGPIGSVRMYNERIPDIRTADLVIVPLIGLGFLLIASRPGVRLIDRVIATGLLLVAAGLLATRHPLQGPVVWRGPDQHGLHLGDSLAAIPTLLGLQILVRSRVPPGREHQRSTAGDVRR